MDDTTKGFRLGEAGFFPWGTRFDAVVRDFEGTGYASRILSCSEAYGFVTRSAEPSAPRPDRPVLTVTYELAATANPARDLFAPLVMRLGAPQKIERDELSGVCQAALHRLPEAQAHALQLAFLRGWTHEEIAHAQNEPLGTIKARIRRGLQALRQALKDYRDA